MNSIAQPPAGVSLWPLYLIVLPIVVIFLFANPFTIITIVPAAVIVMYCSRVTRIHAVLWTMALAYSALSIYWSHQFHYPSFVIVLLRSWLLFAAPYILYEPLESLSALVFLNGIWFVPIVAVEWGYCLYRRIKRPILLPATVLLLLVNGYLLFFQARTALHFHCVKNYTGQTLDERRLFESCGPPLFTRRMDRSDSPSDHYVYTDGSRIIPVEILGDGNVYVSEKTYWLFD